MTRPPRRAPRPRAEPETATPAPVSRDHAPVLLRAVLGALAPADGEVHVDATYGRGGYTEAILAAAECRVVALDRDPAAVAAGQAAAECQGGRLTVIRGRFGRLDAILEELGAAPVDGVAMDLGVSSPQLDTADRGFSFRYDGPLDMRMDAEGPSAADAVNTLPEAELAAILRELGEERHARRVAKAIVAARTKAPIERTGTLADIVRRVVPRSRDGIDPATRTFQALRLHVNDEMGELDRGLAAAERVLRPGGRLVVVSFHSLEDRRVKRFLAERSRTTAGVSRHRPVTAAEAARQPSFRLIGRKPVTPTAEETAENPRARSARLRAAVRTEAPPQPLEAAA
ncbi:MAG: 16S rRNA (cytosine(1402)-N(4))-methyltransferase RsmH [Azospirillaceae bacterium]